MSRPLAARCMLAALLLAALTACGRDATASDGHELKIALNVALTGAGSEFGVPPKCAWEVVSGDYNRAGGLPVGNKRYRINLIVDDNNWDPTGTPSPIEKKSF